MLEFDGLRKKLRALVEQNNTCPELIRAKKKTTAHLIFSSSLQTSKAD